MNKPLEGITVLDFSQYMAGPLAALRLADLGAHVIKIERPDGGDPARNLAISNMYHNGSSVTFNSINRGKDSVALNLKDPSDLAEAKELIKNADVLIENFRPGIMDRLGLDYESVKELNQGIVYASVSGYGNISSLASKPGQDLLVQAMSGVMHLSGNRNDPPMPFGLAIADMYTANHLVQGILAALLQKGRTQSGTKVEVSLLESTLDLQFEVLTAFFNDGQQLPVRSMAYNAHAYLGAPYGIYETKNGHLALAMGSILKLGELIGLDSLKQFENEDSWFNERDTIKALIGDYLKLENTQHWLDKLEPADFWCAEVLDWGELNKRGVFEELGITQIVGDDEHGFLTTTRCPIRFDGQILTNNKPAPKLGETQD